MATFERIRYPDGQVSAKFIKRDPSDIFNRMVRERINSYEDLFYVRAIADVLSQMDGGTKKYNLFIPCMFGQRSDRRFSEFQSFDLKLITDIINECDFGGVSVLDPHSDVALALINNSSKESSFQYVKYAVEDIRVRNTVAPEEDTSDILLVSPDAGAYKKVYEFGEKLNLPTMGAMKCRVNGAPSVMFTHDVEGKDCLIVDDLCDGGATFISLANLLKLHKARSVYLYVTHGLFSKGFVGLHASGINHVYCTNSVRDINSDVAKVFRTSEEMYPENYMEKDYVTQYKVI